MLDLKIAQVSMYLQGNRRMGQKYHIGSQKWKRKDEMSGVSPVDFSMGVRHFKILLAR